MIIAAAAASAPRCPSGDASLQQAGYWEAHAVIGELEPSVVW